MAETAVKASGTGAGRPVDVCFARTGTEWRLPQQAENRFRDTKALLAEEWILNSHARTLGTTINETVQAIGY